MKRYRLILGIGLILALIQGWWFVLIPLGLIGAWAWPFYVEIIVAGIVYDALYVSAAGAGARGFLGTIVSLAIIVLMAGLKMVVRR